MTERQKRDDACMWVQRWKRQTTKWHLFWSTISTSFQDTGSIHMG